MSNTNNRVIHFEVQADNVERAKQFYEKAFGWKIEKWSGEEEMPMDYWMVMTGEKGKPGIDGGMYQRPKEPEKKFKTFDCTILVEDINQAVEAVKQNGGMIEKMPDGKETMLMKEVGWFARGHDTEGNRFGLMQATEWKPE
jgi:hypothetical protein